MSGSACTGVVQPGHPQRRGRRRGAGAAVEIDPEITSELWALTRDYAKQETIDPLKGVGRYLTFGVPGALLIGFGMVLLMLSGLRALQTQTGSTFHGSLSWLPYIIVLWWRPVGRIAVTRITKAKR